MPEAVLAPTLGLGASGVSTNGSTAPTPSERKVAADFLRATGGLSSWSSVLPIGIDGGVHLARRRRLRHTNQTTIATMSRMPPATPPAIAPIGLEAEGAALGVGLFVELFLLVLGLPVGVGVGDNIGGLWNETQPENLCHELGNSRCLSDCKYVELG